MNKVAVFGNAGGGKSTLSKHLATVTGLPLIPLDRIKYKPGGGEVSPEEYKERHDQLMQSDQWIIDGYGSLETVWERLEIADTLIYIDLPIIRHYWWVTKRFLKGFFIPPEGWPENSPIVKGTLNSYSVVWLCHKKLTPKYREYVNQARDQKTVYHLRSRQQIKDFCAVIQATSLRSPAELTLDEDQSNPAV